MGRESYVVGSSCVEAYGVRSSGDGGERSSAALGVPSDAPSKSHKIKIQESESKRPGYSDIELELTWLTKECRV